MFTHMEPVDKVQHEARGNTFELEVYRVVETGEYRVFISRDGDGLGMLASASEREVLEGAPSGSTALKTLIQAARDEIDRNEGDQY